MINSKNISYYIRLEMTLEKCYIVLDDICDQAFIYSILCYKAFSFYNMLKYCFNLPLIITSSLMSVLNSNNNQDDDRMKILNISFNIFTALMLVINNNLKFESRADHFKALHMKFLKLTHQIEKINMDDEVLDKHIINEIRHEYDAIAETVQFEIPNHICKSVRDQYMTKKTLPLIINGVKKKDEYRDSYILNKFNQPLNNISNISSSLIYKPQTKTPIVLDVKKTNDIENIQV